MPTETRINSKLLAIVAASLLPVIALAVLVIRPNANEVDVARRAADRLRPLGDVKAFARAAFDHRRAAADYVQSGGRVGRTEMERRAEPLERALAGLERTASEAARGDVAAIRAAWESLKADLDAWARAANVEPFWAKSAAMTGHARRLTAELLGTANGGSGREVIAVLLDDADVASEAGLRSAIAARAGRFDRTSEARVQRLAGSLERHTEALATGYREPTGRSRVESLTRDQSPARADLARRIDEVLRKPVEIDEDAAPGLIRAAERSSELDLDLFEQFAALRTEQLAERATTGRGRIATTVTALAFGLSITLFAAYLVARSLLRQADAMHAAIKRLATGDAKARAAVTSGDELGRLALAFNAALDTHSAAKLPRESADDMPREVGWLAKVIEDVAEQASVQALNATLRATEAGDPGRSVAVATQEVEALTERCATAARQLAALTGSRA